MHRASYLSHLSDSMRAGLGLQVHLWVPIAVENNYCVCSGQIDAESACPRAKEENKMGRVWRIELVHSLLSFFLRNLPKKFCVSKSMRCPRLYNRVGLTRFAQQAKQVWNK